MTIAIELNEQGLNWTNMKIKLNEQGLNWINIAILNIATFGLPYWAQFPDLVSHVGWVCC